MSGSIDLLDAVLREKEKLYGFKVRDLDPTKTYVFVGPVRRDGGGFVVCGETRDDARRKASVAIALSIASHPAENFREINKDLEGADFKIDFVYDHDD